MKNDLFDVVLIVRLFLDILAVWGLIYMALRLFRNNYRTIQILKGILILLFVYWYSHRSNKEPHEYILVVSFDDGYYYDLCEDERFKKLAQFEKNNNEFIAKTKLNEVYLKNACKSNTGVIQ